MFSTALVVVAASASVQAALQPRTSVSRAFPDLTACIDAPLTYSCENTTPVANTCCSPTPGGLVLLTQFWSTYTGFEKQGQKLPKESWGIHGLWPDNCDGTFESYCDLSRQIDPDPSPAVLPDGTVVPPWTGRSVDKVIADFQRHDLLDFMNDYWVNQAFKNPVLWAHEYAKHATCTSTFDVACYGEEFKEDMDAINYFDATVRAFKAYPTFDILAAYDIVPSNTTTYTLAQIQGALVSQTGQKPFLGCANNGTELNEVWYFSHVLGTEQYGHYKHVETTRPSSCAATGIHYYERSHGSEREVRK